MKVLVVAEGTHELGDGRTEGALCRLVRRLLPESDGPIEFVTRFVDSREVETQALRRIGRGKGHRYTKRAVRWVRRAQQLGCDAIVLLADQDDEPERHAALAAAQAASVFPGIRRAFGVPVRAFDAWIFADEAAVGTVLGYDVDRHPDPEGESDPKGVCRKLRDGSGSSLPLREVYAEVADRADLDRLRGRCPRGFAPFAERVRGIAER